MNKEKSEGARRRSDRKSRRAAEPPLLTSRARWTPRKGEERRGKKRSEKEKATEEALKASSALEEAYGDGYKALELYGESCAPLLGDETKLKEGSR